MRRSHRQPWFCTLFVAAALVCAAARAHAHDFQDEIRWSDGYTLIVLDAGADLHAATRVIQARGGTVALQLPPRALTGWIAPELDASLIGHAGIRGIVRDPAGLSAALARQHELRGALRFFDRAARGRLELGAAESPAAENGAFKTNPASRDAGFAGADLIPGSNFAAGPGVLLPDAFDRPPVAAADVLANLQRQGVNLRKAGGTASVMANSETMTGTISVALFFVESNGAGADADTIDWTTDAEQDVYEQAAAALSWWSSQAKKRSGCWAVFRLEPHFATQDARCAQWRELSLRPSTDFGAAVSEIYGNFGYTVGGHMARGIAFNAALRTENETDWAFSAFVVANPTGATSFTDGYAAWAYLGGPYAALLQRSFGWSFKQVFAHESAHAFRACDEYSVEGYGGCTSCNGCADTGVANGNCEACTADPASCMMRANTFNLCSYTIGQLGWNRAPCVPQALPAPRLDQVQPGLVAHGAELHLDLYGVAFAPGCTVECGDGVQVLSVIRVDATRVQARIRVGTEIAAGPRDVTLTGPDGQADILTGALQVYATPRHYVSAQGGNVFPFDQPARAAIDLNTVLNVCSAGDTVYVTSGTFAPFAIHKTLTILGSWSADFQVRTPATFRSSVQGAAGAPAVQIDGAGNHTVLDGFTIQGGAGSPLFTMELGSLIAGGGVLCYDAAPVLRNCTLQGNTAGSPAAPSGGGGLFAWRAAPTLEQCTVRTNAAGRGAGLLLLSSDATIVDCSIEANDAGGAGAGAGIAVVGGRLTLRRTRVAGNTGAADGGGLYAQGATSILLDGAEFDAHHVTHDGGAVYSIATAVTCTGSRFTRNSAGNDGGAFRVVGGSLNLESVLLAANGAGHGAGGAHGSEAAGILWNVTIAANTGGAGSGLQWMGAASSLQLRSCVAAGNSQGALLYSGALPAALDWNLAWNNGPFDWAGALPGLHDLPAAAPRFVAPEGLDYGLALGSPLFDRGDPEPARRDVDGSRNDPGAHGGPRAATPAMERVMGLVARDFGAHIWVQWNPSRDRHVASYALYRAAPEALDPSVLDPLVVLPAASTSFDDPSPLAGTAYAVVAVDLAGHASAPVTVIPSAHATDAALPPAVFALHSVAPNPANPGAWVEFELPAAVTARLTVYDAHGRPVRVLAPQVVGAGAHRIYWDGRDGRGTAVASGVYWVAIAAGKERRTRRLVLIR